jgi:hypothetical protein
VSQTYALLVGLDESADLPNRLYAAAEARAFATALTSVGEVTQFLLTDRQATRSAIESRLRKLTKEATAADTIWVVMAMPGFVEDEQIYLACSDSQEDDLAPTSLALRDLVQVISATGASARILLDVPRLPAEELKDLFPKKGKLVCLTAAQEEEESHAAQGQRLWLHAIGGLLVGKGREAIGNEAISSKQLLKWLTKELPRLIRQTIAEPTPQTPGSYGPDGEVLPAIIPAKVGASFDPGQWKRVLFQGETRQKIKNLKGYSKSFRMPENANDNSAKWVARIATDDIQEQVEETYNALREHLGFKRKDLDSGIGPEGQGFIRTPAFDYSITLTIDPNELSDILWKHEISSVSQSHVFRQEGFQKVFTGRLGTLRFDFEKPIDLLDIVDRIEENPPPGTKIRVDPQGHSCELTLKGFVGRILLEPKHLRIEGTATSSPDSLIEQFFQFQSKFPTNDHPKAIKN